MNESSDSLPLEELEKAPMPSIFSSLRATVSKPLQSVLDIEHYIKCNQRTEMLTQQYRKLMNVDTKLATSSASRLPSAPPSSFCQRVEPWSTSTRRPTGSCSTTTTLSRLYSTRRWRKPAIRNMPWQCIALSAVKVSASC